MNVKKLAQARRARKTRGRIYSLQERKHGLPALKVFRSGRHVYAQVVVRHPLTRASTVVAAASTVEAELKSRCKYTGNKDAAKIVGQVIAERALQLKQNYPLLPKVAFDRGGYKYHGRIASLAEGAREAGLDF